MSETQLIIMYYIDLDNIYCQQDGAMQQKHQTFMEKICGP